MNLFSLINSTSSCTIGSIDGFTAYLINGELSGINKSGLIRRLDYRSMSTAAPAYPGEGENSDSRSLLRNSLGWFWRKVSSVLSTRKRVGEEEEEERKILPKIPGIEYGSVSDKEKKKFHDIESLLEDRNGRRLDCDVAGYDLMRVWGEREDRDLRKERVELKKKFATLAEPKIQTPALTHIGPEGQARMVDVSKKPVTTREATAEGTVIVNPEIMMLMEENRLKKGDALTVAQVAGVLGAKRTPELVPLCHSIPLSDVQVRLSLDRKENAIKIQASVKCAAKTGAEMEALTGVCLAALTVYDMCKSVSTEMVIEGVRLVKKTGGKSDLDHRSRLGFLKNRFGDYKKLMED